MKDMLTFFNVDLRGEREEDAQFEPTAQKKGQGAGPGERRRSVEAHFSLPVTRRARQGRECWTYR